MSGLLKGYEIEEKWTRPKTRREALEQIRATYAYNDWDKAMQAEHLRDIGLSGDWEKLDNDKLKIILKDFERARMVLYKD